MLEIKVFFFVFLQISISSARNSASEKFCKKNKCDINPDAYLTTPQIIRRHGYASESHVIQTEDGYLLTLHRIPASKNGTAGNQPVFLQHGLLSSSSDWVDSEENSLAFILSDSGYDVWLGNARGNFYSRAHVNLSLSSAQFWNFSWHEMGIKDLPAAITFIVNKTGKPGEVIYVGHSMGTTMFFVFSSLMPRIAKNVKAMIALAPVAYMTHLTSPIRYLSPFTYDFEWIAKYLGINEFLPNSKILKLLSYECELMKNEREICEDVLFLLCGFDKEQFNQTLLPVILSHVPAGTSTKTVMHYLQEIKHEGKFRYFDYGPEGNMIKYGNSTPPQYNITNIKVPTYLMFGENDKLANPIDVLRLSKKIPNLIGLYDVPYPKFSHIDFLWGKDAPVLVYKQLIKVIKKYSNN